jgi:hypothetical protein
MQEVPAPLLGRSKDGDYSFSHGCTVGYLVTRLRRFRSLKFAFVRVTCPGVPWIRGSIWVVSADKR